LPMSMTQITTVGYSIFSVVRIRIIANKRSNLNFTVKPNPYVEKTSCRFGRTLLFLMQTAAIYELALLYVSITPFLLITRNKSHILHFSTKAVFLKTGHTVTCM